MKKILCDKCGVEIKKDFYADDDLKLNYEDFGGMAMVGTFYKFEDEDEPRLMSRKCDLCPACQFKLNSLVRRFMRGNLES